MFINTSRRRSSWFSIGGGLALLTVLALFIPGLPWSEAAAAPTDDTVAAEECVTHYFALDADKESPFAFGPKAIATDVDGLKAELHEVRICDTDLLGDPAITAAHYAEWSTWGLTTEKVAYTDIDALAIRIAADPTLWQSVVTEMEALETASVASMEAVTAGSPSLYMVPNDIGTVNVHQGVTVNNGTALVFTHPSGAVVKFRIECKFQNVRESFPGVPMVPPGTPETPPTTPPTTPPLAEKVPPQDPENQGNNKPGGAGQAPPQPDPVGPPAVGTPPVVYTPAPVPPVVTPPVGSTPDPAPEPAPETSAPPVNDAEDGGCSPALGETTC